MRLRLAALALLSALPAPAAGEPTESERPGPLDGGAERAAVGADREGAARLLRRALARIKDGGWEEAAELLKQARAQDPKSAAIATDYGFALAHLGRRDEAERNFRAAVELDPNRFYAYVNLAELWTSDPSRWQRHEEMVSFLDQALPTLAGDARAHAHVELRLAELLRSLGRPAEARAHLERLTGATTPTAVRRRASQLLAEVDAPAGDRDLEDWPAPEIPAGDRALLDRAKAEPDTRAALAILDPLLGRWPAWTEARWQRARLLERMGQLDEASADLTIVVQLAPSHAHAWRRLGLLLALHGGRLEAERADEALRHALALEPSWSDLRELRQQVAAKRARSGQKPRGERTPEPTAKARQLLQDAQSWMGMEAPEMAPPLLQQALAESPGYVEAAAALYAIEHQVPDPTVKALWNDGPGLWQLVQAVGALRSREAATVARPWLDRAVELDVEEARFARASLRAAAGDRAGALADLRDYVAAVPAPPRLAEARALRLTLTAPTAEDSPERLAHLRLAADRPNDALAALGGGCHPGLPASSLLALGRVHEFIGHAQNALACYQQVLTATPAASPEHRQRAWQRLAAAATGLPPVELMPWEPSLEAAAQAKVALADLALARMAEARKRWPEALALVDTFLAQAGADEPRLVEARALQARVNQVVAQEVEQHNLRSDRLRALGALLAVAGLALWLLGRRYRQPLARALRSQPLLFPALSRAVGQIRHDVLKHRASALELLAAPGGPRDDVARALLEPAPASAGLAGIYQHLAQEARGLGVRLCPLAREPIVGPLYADLVRAEERLRTPGKGVESVLRRVDERLRGEHADRLQGLLRQGPRTRLDARLLARWIDAVAGEPERGPWIAPGMELAEPALDFPLPAATLAAIFGNLLRNAVAAVQMEMDATLAVRVEPGRDGTGRRTVSLLVADSSSRSLALPDIESRPADRGLGIVRESTRAWGGEVVVQAAAPPFRKAVGVRFPAPPAGPR